MFYLAIFSLSCVLSIEFPTCYCPQEWKSDGYCNMGCMYPECNYDSSVQTGNKTQDFLNSDCFEDCGCSIEKLGNNVCDLECDKFECGYDLGDCGLCSSGCFQSDLESNNCKKECLDIICSEYSPNPCINYYCSPGCLGYDIKNYNCQYKCYNSDCDYDGGDCDCYPGCQNTTDDCQTNETYTDPCDHVECSYKDGKCGYCASGCYEHHLGDGICQESCNNTDCNYDNGDCGCAPECSFKYDSSSSGYIQTGNSEMCDLNCLVLDCQFGLYFCTNKTLIKQAVLNYLVYQDRNKVMELNLCDNKCDRTSLNKYLEGNDTCSDSSKCNNKYCYYCMGKTGMNFENCLRQTMDSCILCNTGMIAGKCYNNIKKCPAGYLEQSKLRDMFGNTIWCLKEAIYYSRSNYKEIFVNTSALKNGIGTKADPVKTLYQALINIYAAYTKIYLTNSEVSFLVDTSTSALISDIFDPLKSSTSYLIYELWLIGNFSSTQKTKLYWRDNLKLSPVAQKFYIQNIEFIGLNVLKKNCMVETCFYCPSIRKYFFNYLDDLDNGVTQQTVAKYYSTNCTNYSEVNVFDFVNTVYIENVSFTGFRYQFNSFIRTSGSLYLKNVNFFKMQAKYTGSIILLECKDGCIDSSFVYDQGVVSDIGAGYNDAMNVTSGSFIVSSNFGSVFVYNVTFTYNFVLCNLRSENKGYLIYSKNHLGTITIEDCEFISNYANYLVYVDVSTLIYDTLRLYKGVSMAHAQQHFLMKNVGVISTYCSKGMVFYLMKNNVHNIEIINLSISNSVVGDDGILVFVNEGIITEADLNGGITWVIVYKDIYLKPKFLKLENIKISDSHTGKFSIFVDNYPNIEFKNITIIDVSDGITNYTINNIVDLFNQNDSSRYFSHIDSVNETPELKCNEMVLVSNSIHLFIDSMFISFINCEVDDAPLGLSLYNIINTAFISKLNVASLKAGTRKGIAFTATDSNSIEISELSIYDVKNLKESVIQLENCDTVKIGLARLETVYSNYSSAFIVSKIKSFTLTNFFFSDMSSEYNNGGCLFLQTSIFGASYTLQSGNFTGCSSNNGKGGAIFLDSISRLSLTLFEMNDVWITKSYSYEGTAIFISNTVTFSNKKESKLAKVLIKDNYCNGGGIVSDYHFSGTLKIDGLEMMKNNHGIYVFYSSKYPELYIMNTKIYASDNFDSLIYVMTLVSGPLVNLQNVELYNTKKHAIEAYSLKVNLDQVTILDCYRGIYLGDEAKLEANLLKVSKIKGKAITLDTNSTFHCINCEFKDNSDSILTLSTFSNFSLVNTQIFSNHLTSGYLISLTSGGDKISELTNCQIYSNSLYSGNIVYSHSSKVTIKNSDLIKNEPVSSSVQSIYLFKSFFQIFDSRLQLNGLVENGAFIYAVNGSEIIAENTIFQNSKSRHGNIYGIDVRASISNCVFSGNSGGDIFMIESYLSVVNCRFEFSFFDTPNIGVIEMLKNYKTVISESKFNNISNSENVNGIAYIYDGLSKQLSINDCEFLGSNESVMGVFTKDCISLLIINSKLTEFSSKDYSALSSSSTINTCNLTILNSTITKNWSLKKGGGVYTENCNLIIENTEISFNKAQDSGGGIYFISPNCDNCGIYLIGNTKIMNNSCNGDGGAIKWEDFKPYIENYDLVYNNSASYGADFASVPAKFGVHQDQVFTFNVLTTISNVPPGKKYTDQSLIYLFDTYNQVVKTENSIVAKLFFNETDSNNAASGTTTFRSQNGIFYLSNFTLTGVPGSSGFLIIKSENMKNEDVRNDGTEYLDTGYIQVEFRNCERGEQIQATACVDCIYGKYTLKASYNCLNCPTGGTCTGGDTIIVKNGYWRSSLSSDVIYACDIFDACLGGNKTDELGSCNTGYSGVLCKSCDLGYYLTTSGICVKCSDGSADIPILIILSTAIIIISVVMVKTTLTSAFSPKALHSIYIKIFTNYLQLVFIVTQFELDWPGYVREFFFVQKSGAAISDQLFSIDCYIGNKNSNDTVKVYYIKLFMISVTPLAIFLFSYGYWIFYGTLKETFRYLKREVYTTIIVLLFLVYPNIVKFLFSNFSCIKIDKMNSYLNYNTAIECWDSTHKQFSLTLALPGIILWGIGFPTILLILMVKNRKRLHLDYYRVVFGFLFNGYKESKFYWELTIIYRKVLLITFSVFMISQARLVQALNVILVLLISIYLHHSNEPYKINELNSMEMQALNIASITIYFGLYYLSKSIGQAIEILLFIMILIGNSYFIFYWLRYMLMALANLLIKLFPKFRLRFKRGDVYEEEFYKEEIVQEGVLNNRMEGEKIYTFFKHRQKEIEKDIEYLTVEDAYKDVLKRDIKRIIDRSF